MSHSDPVEAHPGGPPLDDAHPVPADSMAPATLGRTKSRTNRARRGIAAISILVLCLLYCGVRLMDLDRVVTTDEPFWLGRSANFYVALRTGEYINTYQMAHPGVLTMWAGAAAFRIEAPAYSDLVPTNLKNVYSIDSVLRDNGFDPLDLMVAAKTAKILLQAAFFLISLEYIRRLFGVHVVVVAGALIVFDPFLSGLDSALHVDGLFAISSFAAVLGLCYAIRAGHTRTLPWVAAGALAACAWSTRATGIALVFVVMIALLVGVIAGLRRREARSVREVVQVPAFSGLVWGLTAIAASFLLLPALWVDPLGVLDKMWDWASTESSSGHELPTFFRGVIHDSDPGAIFYPVSLLWRLTPVSLIGLVLFLALVAPGLKRSSVSRNLLPGFGVLILFGTIYVAGMTTGAKKFDRYILPVYPIVDLLAAIGYVLLASAIARIRRPRLKLVPVAIIAMAVGGQALSTASVLPYRLDYYNPLMGGATAARDEMQMGWGQGGDQVVAFIESDMADGDQVIMQSSSLSSAFSYFLPDNILHRSFGFTTPAGWYETDYFVPGIQQVQRDLSPSYRLISRYEPVHTVEIEGVPYFEIFTPKKLPLPGTLLNETGCTADVGPGIRLLQVVGRDDSFDLYWLTTGESVPAEIHATVTMMPRDSTSFAAPVTTSASWAPAAAGLASKVSLPIPIAASGLELDQYWLQISLANIATGETMPVTRPGDSAAELSTFVISECYSLPPGSRLVTSRPRS